MYTLLAVLVYAAAIGLPVLLLYYCHSRAWYWHLLAVLVSVVFGLTPIPPAWQTRAFDLVFGFVFVALVVWGFGGLIVALPHRHKHA